MLRCNTLLPQSLEAGSLLRSAECGWWVLVAQQGEQPSNALCAACHTRPYTHSRRLNLDEALGFAVGLRVPAAGERVLDAQSLAGVRKQL